MLMRLQQQVAAAWVAVTARSGDWMRMGHKEHQAVLMGIEESSGLEQHQVVTHVSHSSRLMRSHRTQQVRAQLNKSS
ncbi:GD25048 [Drosophila simulans]|uniref:GD25048 n=1 Tax=Drosophila simulans TaxID=7240 RepID=B4QIP2_DROSI|nr:GD25048 [Drosophila simulans]